MTAASGIPAVIDQLVSTALAAFPVATSLVQVCDGPGNTGDDTGQQLWIGVTDPSDVAEAATSDQEFPYASATFRREQLTIHCQALAWNGDEDQKVVRDLAFAQMQAFTAAIVADASLNGTVLWAASAGSNVSLWQGLNGSKIEARVFFDITATAQFQG